MGELIGEHSGEDVGEMVATVLEEFDIQHRIVYFTLDNAGSNDTAGD